jgi:hypothetical protein
MPPTRFQWIEYDYDNYIFLKDVDMQKNVLNYSVSPSKPRNDWRVQIALGSLSMATCIYLTLIAIDNLGGRNIGTVLISVTLVLYVIAFVSSVVCVIRAYNRTRLAWVLFVLSSAFWAFYILAYIAQI